jgi:twinkle protein
MPLMEIAEISQALTAQVETVAAMLLPGGKMSGREWEAGSVNGEAGRSLKVCVSGDKKGVWADFASGEGGDLLDLWCLTKGLPLAEALKEAKKFLGVEDPILARVQEKKFRKPAPPKGAAKAKAGSPVMQYLTEDRKLLPEVIAAYRVAELPEIGPWEGWKRQEAWKGPWVGFPSFRNGNLLAMKYLHLERRDGKKQTLVESGCEPTCFGWQVIDHKARTIVICEGEIDALSLYQYGFPAVSVPFGAGKGDKQQWVDYDWAELERFETIYLCMDNDKEGAAAVEELVSRLGIHRCRIVTLPYKDANECLKEGVEAKVIARCFSEARYIEPEELKRASDYTQAVIDHFFPSGGKLPGFDMPFPKVPFRFLRGEVTIITGCNGHGKSLLWGQVMLAGAMQGEKACIASFEMTPKSTLARLVRQSTGKETPPKKRIAETLDWLSDKIWIFALVGTGKIDRMLEVFEYAYKRHGIRHFLIDSLMKLGLHEDDYNGQKAVMEKLCDWVNVTGAHVHLIAHPRKEDESVPAGKMAIKGTGALTDLAFNVFSVWRNKKKEQILQAHRMGEEVELPKGKKLDDIANMPDAILVCDKSRNVEGVEGKYGIFFDPRSNQYLNSANSPIIDFHKEYEGYYGNEEQYSYSGGLPE